MSATQELCSDILDRFANKTTGGFETRATMYWALNSGTGVSEAGANLTEPSAANAYARLSTTNTFWTTATDTDPSNLVSAANLTFAQNTTSAWGTMTELCILEGNSAGEVLWVLAINGGAGILVEVGDTLQFDSTNITLTAD